MLIVVYLAVVVAVLFVAAVVATSEEPVLADAPRDAADVGLPAGPVQPEEVTALRFGMAVRGYRMAEVDPVLARLSAELTDRDRRIAELEGALVALAEPQVVQLEKHQEPEPEPAPEPAPEVTELTAPEPAAVHAPVETAPAAFEDFPEVWLPEPAAEGAVEAQEPEPPVFPEPAPPAVHEHPVHTAPEPVWGWPGEGAAPKVTDDTSGGDQAPVS